jgi:hypothetical protein
MHFPHIAVAQISGAGKEHKQEFILRKDYEE